MPSKPKVIIPPQDSVKLKSQISLQSPALNKFPTFLADRFEDFESESADTIIEELFCYIYKSLLNSGRSNLEFHKNIEQAFTGSLDAFVYSSHKRESHDFVNSIFTNCDLSLLFFQSSSQFCNQFYDFINNLSSDFNIIFIRREYPKVSEDYLSLGSGLYDMYYIDRRSYYKHNTSNSVSITNDMPNVLCVKSISLYDYEFPQLQSVTSAVRSLQDIYNDINAYHGREEYNENTIN